MKNTGCYTVLETPMGWMGLAVKHKGIYASTLPRPTKDEAENQLLARLPFKPSYSPQMFRDIENQIKSYFSGDTKTFKCEIDWEWATPFQRKVLEIVRDIPYGSFLTYGEAVSLAGYPGYFRAAGSALKHNNVPLMIPCHRVIKKDGLIGGFTGSGIELKAELLRLEGLTISLTPDGETYKVS